MRPTVCATEWKPEATAENHSAQRSFPLLSEAQSMPWVVMPDQVVTGMRLSAILGYAAQHSGLDDQELAKKLSISKGYMSRFLRGVAEAWAKRLVRFMKETNNLGPLQWMAHQVGCEVVQKDSRAAEIAALQARLIELTKDAA